MKYAVVGILDASRW